MIPVLSVTAPIQHVVVKTTTPYEEFTAKFVSQFGKLDPAVFQKLAVSSSKSEDAKNFFGSPDRLLLFTTYDHGGLLSALFDRSDRAVVYIIGNPLFAAQMTKHDLRAGLYAPLRVMVYADKAGNAEIEYDLPSSLFGQFGNADVTKLAKVLEEKLSQAIEKSSP
jgi:uncharacterized protein (DUF302 family)